MAISSAAPSSPHFYEEGRKLPSSACVNPFLSKMVPGCEQTLLLNTGKELSNKPYLDLTIYNSLTRLISSAFLPSR